MFSFVSEHEVETIQAKTLVEAVKTSRKYANKHKISRFELLNETGEKVYSYDFKAL